MSWITALTRAPIDKVHDAAASDQTPATAAELLESIGFRGRDLRLRHFDEWDGPRRDKRFRAFAAVFDRFAAGATDSEYVRLLDRLGPEVKTRLLLVRYESTLAARWDNGKGHAMGRAGALFTRAHAGDGELYPSEVKAAGGLDALLDDVRRVVTDERDLLLAYAAQPFTDKFRRSSGGAAYTLVPDSWACRWESAAADALRAAAPRWGLDLPVCGGALSRRGR